MRQSWIPYLCIFVTALIVAVATTPLAQKIAHKLGAIDYPNKRRINKVPIPRMGGIALFIAIACAFTVEYLGTTFLGWPTILTPAPHFLSMNYQVLVLGFVVIFLTGAIDDVRSLKPLQKLVGQIIAAVIAVAAGITIGVIINPFTAAPLNLGVFTYPITVLYLVAYVNIFNLIDGLDGLASGIAGIASFTMFSLAVFAKRPDAATLAISLTGATLGFLRYNFYPARIFLGDSGSLLIGYTLGIVSLLSVTRVAGLTTIMVPLVIAAVPILDTFSAIIRRKRAHISIGQADKGHIHHRLIQEGFNQKQAVLLMYAWTAVLCLGTFIMTQVEVGPRIVIFILLFILSAVIALRLHLFRPVLLHHTNPQTGTDELISPENPAFAAEEEKFEEEHHDHLLH